MPRATVLVLNAMSAAWKHSMEIEELWKRDMDTHQIAWALSKKYGRTFDEAAVHRVLVERRERERFGY